MRIWLLKLTKRLENAIQHGPTPRPSRFEETADDLGVFGKDIFGNTNFRDCSVWNALLTADQNRIIYQSSRKSQINRITVDMGYGSAGAEVGLYVGPEPEVPLPSGMNQSSMYVAANNNLHFPFVEYESAPVQGTRLLTWAYEAGELVANAGDRVILWMPTDNVSGIVTWTIAVSR